jgi:hypothetical protein
MVRLIDADALFKAYENTGWYNNADRDEIAEKILLEQPTIDAEPQWIPCSERLPENMEPVNITWVNRDPEPYYMNIKDKPFTATGIYYKGKWYWWSSTCADMLYEYGENEIDEVADGVDIVAWMPLPEPYEVEE